MASTEADIIELNDVEPKFILDGLEELHEYFLLERTKQLWEYLLAGRFERAVEVSQIVIDRTWEHLNTGYWKDVDIHWRYVYSFASLIKSYSLYKLDTPQAAIVACDMGLLMGAPIFSNILSKMASKLQQAENKQCHDITKQPVAKKQKYCDRKAVGSPNKKNYANPNSTLSIEDKIQDNFKIKNIEPPSLITFQTEHMLAEIPVVIRNSFNHWPAMKENRWTVDYLKSVAGSRTVPVEIGDKYTSENWTQKLLTVKEFIDRFVVAANSSGYLAQHQLFEQIPELRKDIMIPDYCYLSPEENDEVLIHAWFGPKGTVSPLHHDPYHNLLSQVVGSKYIRLYNRIYSDVVYPNQDSMLDNTSRVDLENVDESEFPKFSDVPYLECILNEGEMLYIPPKWWHFVKSLSTSFSVSFWWK